VNTDDPVPVIVIAHEFFDALPINIFQYQKNMGWSEKLVNINHQGDEFSPF
jgi:NADH dehydrogenase [ubiquinone] 1 alpha subcomplex assembly factor 7